MIRLHEITGDEQLLERYATTYARVGGLPIDPSYLARGRVFAWIDGAGQMLGGYVFNTTSPFRSLAGLREEEQRSIMARLDLAETFEFTCLWMRPELRGGLASMRCWASLILHLRRFPRRDLLGFTVADALLRMYMQADAEILSRSQIESDRGPLSKYVLLLRGKRGLVSAFAGELVRRALRQAMRHLRGLGTPARAPRASRLPAQGRV